MTTGSLGRCGPRRRRAAPPNLHSQGTDVFGAQWILMTVIVAGTFTTTVSAQNSGAVVLLGRMSSAIAALENFIVRGEAYTDARLAAGQIIEHASEVIMHVRRPGMMRITNRDTENTKEIFFSDGVLSVYSERHNFYAQTKTLNGIESAAAFAINEVGIDAPLLDFALGNISDHLLEDAEDVRHVGTSLIRGDIYDHIAVRTPEIDLQIWIASEGPPLPGKMVISSKWEAGVPRFVVFLKWDTDPAPLSDSFSFVPPEDAAEIEFILDL